MLGLRDVGEWQGRAVHLCHAETAWPCESRTQRCNKRRAHLDDWRCADTSVSRFCLAACSWTLPDKTQVFFLPSLSLSLESGLWPCCENTIERHTRCPDPGLLLRFMGLDPHATPQRCVPLVRPSNREYNVGDACRDQPAAMVPAGLPSLSCVCVCHAFPRHTAVCGGGGGRGVHLSCRVL